MAYQPAGGCRRSLVAVEAVLAKVTFSLGSNTLSGCDGGTVSDLLDTDAPPAGVTVIESMNGFII